MLIALVAGVLIAGDMALIVCRRRAWVRALAPVAFGAFIAEIVTLTVVASRHGAAPAAASAGIAAFVSVLALSVVVCAQTDPSPTQRTGHGRDAEPDWWATFERELADYVERGRQR